MIVGALGRSLGSKRFGRMCLLYKRRKCLGGRCGGHFIGTVLPRNSAVGCSCCRKGGAPIGRTVSLTRALPFFTRHELVMFRGAKFFGATTKTSLTSCVGSVPRAAYFVFIRRRVSGEGGLCGTIGSGKCVTRLSARSTKALGH